MSLIEVTVTNTVPAQASATPPAAADLTATAIVRGVIFLWERDLWIQPYTWQYRTQVAAEGWSAWTTVLFPIVIRTLTAAELTSAGATANIQVEVRSTDGAGAFSATVAANTSCLALVAGAADIADGSVGVAELATAVTDRMFLTSAKSPGQLASDNTIVAGMIAADAVGASELANDAVDANAIAALAVTTAKIDNLAVTTGKIGADAVDNTKLADNAVQNENILNATVDVAKLAASATARMFDTGGRTKLDGALPVAVNSLDVSDRIGVIVGTNKNLVASAASIKTDLSLNLVDNVSANTIRAALTEANIQAGDGVTFGAASNLAAKINLLAALIESSALKEVVASIIKNAAAGTALFDASGNYTAGALAGVGIKSGATVVEPADIIAAISTTGRAQNLDLTSIAAGTLDNIPETGSDKTVTANEKLGAAYAYLGINSSGKLTGGTTSFTTAQVEENIDDYYEDFNDFKRSTSAVITDVDVIDVTGDASEQWVFECFFQKRKGGMTEHLRYRYLSDGAGILTPHIRDESGNALGTPVSDVFPVASTVGSYVAKEHSLTIPVGDAAGTWYRVRLFQNMAVGVDIKIKDLRVWQTK